MTRFRILIISPFSLLREGLAQRFRRLAFDVFPFPDLVEPIRRFNELDPDVAIIDGDRSEREWKVLMLAVKKARKRIIAVFLKTRISIDEANELLGHGFSAAILKPFSPEVHLPKILSVINRGFAVEKRRSAPRFYLDPAVNAQLRFFSPRTGAVEQLSIINVSSSGLEVRTEFPENLPELKPSTVLPAAALSIGELLCRVQLEVRHRSGEVLGMNIVSFTEGKADYEAYLGAVSRSVFGAAVEGGLW